MWRLALRAASCLQSGTRSCSSAATQRTALYDLHLKHGGRMVTFGGWELPVQYQDQEHFSIAASHLHTREHASLFDVSHMLQTRVTGRDVTQFMEALTVCDVTGLAEGTGSLTLFTNDQGGIHDDLIVTKVTDQELYVVSNAGCRDKDLDLLQSTAADFRGQGRDVTVEVIENDLVALQGPEAAAALQSLVADDLAGLTFMRSKVTAVCGAPCRVTRCGYTGEDGFELSVQTGHTAGLVEALLQAGDVRLAGLGARDSLRLEAGLCLYGNDIDETTTPVEAGLAWTVAKRRRQEGGFPGSEVILGQLKVKPGRRRVGLVSQGPPARTGCEILSEAGEPVGMVTSGVPSPSLGVNVAMGYVRTELAKAGTPVQVQVRKKQVAAQVAKMPFVPAKYYT